MKTTLYLFRNVELPRIEQEFIKQFDGTLESVFNFKDINIVLNPCSSAHYFYVSGETSENMVTTKSTDKSFGFDGSETEEQRENAYKLAMELKKFIMFHNPKALEDLTGENHELLRTFGKISHVRRRAAFLVDGKIITIPGINIPKNFPQGD